MDQKVILIADDADLNREMLKLIFNEQFYILEARDGQEAIDTIAANKETLSVIFLDLVMPNKDGIDVLKYMADENLKGKIPVIMITGEATDATDEKAYEYGASDIIYKPFSPNVVMRRTLNIIELFESKAILEKQLVEETNQFDQITNELKESNAFLIDMLSSVVEFRGTESSDHISHIQTFTSIMLNYVREYYPKYGLTEEQCKLITIASALHDLGKISIPDSILLKPGKLTPEEFAEMKKHTTFGSDIIAASKKNDSEFYTYCYDICRYHHERYDGNGYPDRLSGDDIPIWAQVVSIVDVYDALINKRVYKPVYEYNEAMRMIKDGECGVFSPEIMDCFDLAKEELIATTIIK